MFRLIDLMSQGDYFKATDQPTWTTVKAARGGFDTTMLVDTSEAVTIVAKVTVVAVAVAVTVARETLSQVVQNELALVRTEAGNRRLRWVQSADTTALTALALVVVVVLVDVARGTLWCKPLSSSSATGEASPTAKMPNRVTKIFKICCIILK